MRVEDATDQKSLPPRILQGDLFYVGSTLMLRFSDQGADFVNVLSVLRLYRDRRVTIAIIDPSHTGNH